MVAENDHVENALEQPSQKQAAATLRQQAQRSTRDYFAGQIMSGVLADTELTIDNDAHNMIKEVFDLADAMLAESQKRGGW